MQISVIACNKAAILAGVAKIIAQLFYTWFHVQLLHATRCNFSTY